MTEQTTRTFNYLDELNFKITASESLLNRVERHFDPTDMLHISNKHACVIRANEHKPFLHIIKDKQFPYSRCIDVRGILKYYRYNTLVSRTRHERDEFIVDSFTEGNAEAIITCARNFYLSSIFSRPKALINGSLVYIQDKGTLIVAPLRAGKTTLLLRLIEREAIQLVSEGLVLAEKKEGITIGEYVLNPIYIRLYPFANSKLSILIPHIDECETNQPLDPDAYSRITRAKYWCADENITISRQKYAESLRLKTKPAGAIQRIVIPKYSTDSVSVKKAPLEIVLTTIRTQIRSKQTVEGNVPSDADFDLIKDGFDSCQAKTITFSRKEDLTETVLDDLLED
jgi:hypothetical protein